MNESKRIRSVTVKGLQGVFDYSIEFPTGSETIILIAPNGSGKTALLSLIKDCASLNLRRVSTHIFNKMVLTFRDGSRWEFTKSIDEDRARLLAARERHLRIAAYEEERLDIEKRYYSSGSSVSFKRFNPAGREIKQAVPDVSNLNPRMLSRVLERLPSLSISPSGRVRDARTGRLMSSTEAFQENYTEVLSNPQIVDMLSATYPSIAWPGIDRIECLFIETQRLLYSRDRTVESPEKSAPLEEILRQAQSLSSLLQKNYSDYANTSQALDRSFPNRLIARARSGVKTDTDLLRIALSEVEKRRADLTEAGILIEQSDAIVATDGDLVAQVVDALQIYVEDSKKKLGTYDEIYPKISVFLELMNAKLKPKRITIGREFGAAVWRDKQKLDLTGLSSGEKHEFIMLFKLIFETEPDALVLIDEPEISLHVVWQLEFMQDLRSIQANNPFQSIIATHSPQIFQGFHHVLIDLADQIA